MTTPEAWSQDSQEQDYYADQQVVAQIDEQPTVEAVADPGAGLEYVHSDGTVYQAEDVQKAREVCPVLGQMAVEQANLMVRIAALGQAKIRQQAEDRKEPVERQEANLVDTIVIEKTREDVRVEVAMQSTDAASEAPVVLPASIVVKNETSVPAAEVRQQLLTNDMDVGRLAESIVESEERHRLYDGYDDKPELASLEFKAEVLTTNSDKLEQEWQILVETDSETVLSDASNSEHEKVVRADAVESPQMNNRLALLVKGKSVSAEIPKVVERLDGDTLGSGSLDNAMELAEMSAVDSEDIESNEVAERLMTMPAEQVWLSAEEAEESVRAKEGWSAGEEQATDLSEQLIEPYTEIEEIYNGFTEVLEQWTERFEREDSLVEAIVAGSQDLSDHPETGQLGPELTPFIKVVAERLVNTEPEITEAIAPITKYIIEAAHMLKTMEVEVVDPGAIAEAQEQLHQLCAKLLEAIGLEVDDVSIGQLAYIVTHSDFGIAGDIPLSEVDLTRQGTHEAKRLDLSPIAGRSGSDARVERVIGVFVLFRLLTAGRSYPQTLAKVAV